VTELVRPSWTLADIALVQGRVVDPRRSHDPIGAKIFLGCRARRRLTRLALGIRPTGVRATAWLFRQVVREATALLGLSVVKGISAESLHRLLTAELGALGIRAERLSEETHLHLPEQRAHTEGPWPALGVLGKRVQQMGGTLILHGSQADGLTTAFSDFDLLLLVDPWTPGLKSIIDEVENVILAEDPLQHHGVLVASSATLPAYWPSVLPLETLSRAAVLGSERQLTFRVLDEPFGAANLLYGMLRAAHALVVAPEPVRGLWDWKFKVSQVLLIPTLVLATLGRPLYKGDSFSAAQPLFSSDAWHCIRQLSEVRRDWPDDYPCSHYARQKERRFGRLTDDPAAVHEGIAAFRRPGFRTSLDLLISEVKMLVGLESLRLS